MDENFYFEKNDDSGKLPERFKTGLATWSFVISLVNIIFGGFVFSFVLSPLSVILGVMSIVKKQGGRAFAVIGIVLSVVSLIIFSIFTAVFVKVYPDMEYFIRNDTAVISEFEENGEIPEQFEKYRSPEYDKYWHSMGCDDFDSFFAVFIDIYRQTQGLSTPADSGSPYTPYEPDDGEELVDLSLLIHN